MIVDLCDLVRRIVVLAYHGVLLTVLSAWLSVSEAQAWREEWAAEERRHG